MTWKQARKRRGRIRAKAFVSIREGSFGISVDLLENANAVGRKHVDVHFDGDRKRIGFCFHLKRSPDSFSLIREGNGRTRVVQASSLYRQLPWLRAAKGRRFPAKYDGKNKLWFVTVRRSR